MIEYLLSNSQYHNLRKLATYTTATNYVRDQFNGRIRHTITKIRPYDLNAANSYENFDITVKFETEKELFWFLLHV